MEIFHHHEIVLFKVGWKQLWKHLCHSWKRLPLCTMNINRGIAYCTEPQILPIVLRNQLAIDIILYCQYGNNSLEKIKPEGITDLTLLTEKVDFEVEEPNLIVEEDSIVLEDIFPQQ